MEDQNTVDGFSGFDFGIDEASEAEAELQQRLQAPKTKQICICGHAVGRHTFIDARAIWNCKPTRMDCPCKELRPVLQVQDTRPFLRKTQGAGPLHALSRGMLAANEAGVEMSWIEEPACDNCGVVGPVSPVPFTKQGYVSLEATGIDKLICRKCREQQ